MNTIFDTKFLEYYLNNFQLSKIDGIELKMAIVSDWQERLKSNRVPESNETSFDTDFINDIFGDVLGYNYRNPNYWNLEKKIKTKIDAQKPDACLGYFSTNKRQTIKAVIELKDSKTNLEKKQNRSNDKRTPIEQAFGYAPKYGIDCKWVIVSNIREIRLYQASDSSKYEIFKLIELNNEQEFKRFYYLLCFANLINQRDSSKIENLIVKQINHKHLISSISDTHLIDQMYHLITKFDGIKFINPNIIANAAPFNKSKNHVWHYNENFCLQSSEEGFYELFKEIIFTKTDFTISRSLENELSKKGVIEYIEKLRYIFRRLNDCLIISFECYKNPVEISNYLSKPNVLGGSLRTELIKHKDQLQTFNINLQKGTKDCSCLNCLLLKLDFSALLEELKAREGTDAHNSFETAYFHHFIGTNGFKTTFLIYKKIAEFQYSKNIFSYFIAKVNIASLHNLIESYYDLKDKDSLLSEIKAIDIDTILNDLDVIDEDQREYLIEIKDGQILKLAQNETDEIITALERVRRSFEINKSGIFPNYTQQLHNIYVQFITFYSSNYILGDVFYSYKKVCYCALKGFLISHTISDAYYARLRDFDIMHINLMIFDLAPDELDTLFRELKINKITITERAKSDLLVKIKNFLKSNHTNTKFFGDAIENKLLSEALTSHHFEQTYSFIFSNLFFILNKITLDKDDISSFCSELSDFLTIDSVLYSARIKTLSRFILDNGDFFTPIYLNKLLQITTEHKYLADLGLIKYICQSILKSHPSYRLSDIIFTKNAILKTNKSKEYPTNLIDFYNISDTVNQNLLREELISILETKFSNQLYCDLVRNRIIDINFNGLFNKYLKLISLEKNALSFEIWNEKPLIHNTSFINFALFFHSMNLEIDENIANTLGNLESWQKWVLAPQKFDYSQFKVEWILVFDWPIILNKLVGIPSIQSKIRESLKSNYHQRLSEIYIQYFI